MSIVAALTPLAPTLLVLEATGTYHQPLLAALLVAELPVSVINPAQSAAFRKQHLGRNKTDRGDARLLARFAERHHADLRLATPQEPDLARLRQLVGYRDDLVAQQTAARNRQHAAEWAGDALILGWLADDLADLRARLAQVNRAIAAVLATIPDSAVLTAQVGVGLLTAVLDLDPDAPVPEPEPWDPQPEPSSLALVGTSWSGLAGDLADRTAALARLATLKEGL